MKLYGEPYSQRHAPQLSRNFEGKGEYAADEDDLDENRSCNDANSDEDYSGSESNIRDDSHDGKGDGEGEGESEAEDVEDSDDDGDYDRWRRGEANTAYSYPDVKIALRDVSEDVPEPLRHWVETTGGNMTITHGSVIIKMHQPTFALTQAFIEDRFFIKPEFATLVQSVLPEGYAASGLKFIQAWENPDKPSLLEAAELEPEQHYSLCRPAWLEERRTEPGFFSLCKEWNGVLHRVLRSRFDGNVFTFFALRGVSVFNFKNVTTGESRFLSDAEKHNRMIVQKELKRFMRPIEGSEDWKWDGETGFLIFSFSKSLVNSASDFAYAVLDRLREIETEELVPLQRAEEVAFAFEQGLAPIEGARVRYARAVNVDMTSGGGLCKWLGNEERHALVALHLEFLRGASALDVAAVVNNTAAFPLLQFVYVAQCTGPDSSTPEHFAAQLLRLVHLDRRAVLIMPPTSHTHLLRPYATFTSMARRILENSKRLGK